ncbi:uncharacterized protein TRIVIDRAFT_42417 [Trichoderma virens Gv29-8]|uniref:Branched-chain-amino-acid aminotransferase n=1 Tax=Hypocrea virens (strain Gv29-8 / FGSC 10586) TaxID=413071 RepID=G9N8H2_HYPVG|nr:uncharacterized protein TRIVIDRAFT_42417 [Trichoderma virens Gv29-8]EHK17279.1 hypothetical protein TRIVIDRAFT_42417 [Trichoderma virens Gv29-8]
MQSSKPSLRPLDASKLKFTKTTTPMAVPKPGDPVIATHAQCTDHMITAIWRADYGWEDPELKPYTNFSLPPTASVFHYATECLEGMKMYRGYDGMLRLFRPDANCKRMLASATRISLPAFDPEELEKLIMTFIATDGPKWLPEKGSSLYLRPTMIGSSASLAFQTPKECTLFVIACFMPPPNSPLELRLMASQKDMVRAWPGGFGYAKVGANYGPSLLANCKARGRSYDQVLWLFGEEREVTEAGASNFFIVWRTADGKSQLVTAPLDVKMILDGVTRRSILQLVRERLASGQGHLEALEIVERKFTMDEVADAVDHGRVIEAFAAGTAYFVAPVSAINYQDRDLEITIAKDGYAALIKSWLADIMYGNEHHEWGVVVEEKQLL